jgi:hypothetical protein
MRRIICVIIFTTSVFTLLGQEIQTIFKHGRVGGYGAISNKFTHIGGQFANMPMIYGGVFINRRVMLGLGGGVTTNNIPVPDIHREISSAKLSYAYGQAGLVTEWVWRSNRSIHLVFHLFTGAGYTMQYDRSFSNDQYNHDAVYDENWFMVAEPGVQLEVNLFKWMRFSPGISYRKAYDSQARGLTDDDLTNWTYSATLKFGRF